MRIIIDHVPFVYISDRRCTCARIVFCQFGELYVRITGPLDQQNYPSRFLVIVRLQHRCGDAHFFPAIFCNIFCLANREIRDTLYARGYNFHVHSMVAKRGLTNRANVPLCEKVV